MVKAGNNDLLFQMIFLDELPHLCFNARIGVNAGFKLDISYQIGACNPLAVFLKGGDGAIDLAKKVQHTLETRPSIYHPIYDLNAGLKDKIAKICTEIYHAGEVSYSPEAERQLAEYERMGFSNAYICMAKTPASFTDDPTVLGAPKGFKITVREVRLAAGSNFVIPLTGKILTMPGLPKVPAAVKMEDLPW